MSQSREMTFGEMMRIFGQHIGVLMTTFIVTVMVAVALWLVRPVDYNVSVLVDIARMGDGAGYVRGGAMAAGAQRNDAYEYDEYYRLQADEQFAETVTHWLKTPRVVSDVLATAAAPMPESLRGFEKYFLAHRVSPLSISVQFSAANPIMGTRVADAMSRQLNARAASLNYNTVENEWFVVKVSEPVMARDQVPFALVAIVSAVAGVVLGLIGVIIAHMIACAQTQTQRIKVKPRRKKRRGLRRLIARSRRRTDDDARA